MADRRGTRFRVDFKTGEIVGPADYMASESFRCTKEKVENGTHALIGASPTTPLATLVEVIFQTDYAAWLGQRQFAAMRGGAR